jgi:hypothetical protein
VTSKHNYRHRQIGTLLLWVLGIGAAINVALLLFSDPVSVKMIAVSALAMLVFSMILFGSLTVTVTRDSVKVWFGPGIIRKAVRLEDIRDSRVVRNPWYYGWGIRLTPNGWLFSVSGLEAVELDLASGLRFRIGTDEPERLHAALQQAVLSAD